MAKEARRKPRTRVAASGPNPSGGDTSFEPAVVRGHEWLLTRARQWPEYPCAGCIEALVYCKSRSADCVVEAGIAREWLLQQVECEVKNALEEPQRKRPRRQDRHGPSRLLQLESAIARDPLSFEGLWWLSHSDDETDVLQSILFRAVEWLDVPGLTPLLRHLLMLARNSTTLGIEPRHACLWLFAMCRSDLALSMDAAGLNYILATVSQQYPLGHAPWEYVQVNGAFGVSPSAAAMYAFAALRLHSKVGDAAAPDLVQKALDVVQQSQLASGGWTHHVSIAQPNLYATCAAVHALGCSQGSGVRTMLDRAAKWLVAKQNPDGSWGTSYAPAFDATLVMDALTLCGHGDALTFRRRQMSPETGAAVDDLVRLAAGDLASQILSGLADRHTSYGTRTTRARLARRVGCEESGAFNRKVAELAKARLIETRPSRNGGIWITERGQAVFREISA